VTPGLWYLIAVADDGDAVNETFESNNTRYDSMLIGPDLDMTSISAPTTGVAGATISISSSTKNIGAEAAPASTTRVYLSLNTSFDSSDTLLGERTVPALAPNISNTGTASVVLPSDMIGKYYIIAVADAPGVVEESSESNNTIARAITISK
jgi:subtilase family serine protease